MIFLIIMAVLQTVVCCFFISRYQDKIIRLRKDVNALNSSVTAIEKIASTHYIASDFRIKLLEDKLFGRGDSGFNLDKLRKGERADDRSSTDI